MTATAPYPIFDRTLFPRLDEALGWENLQYELFRSGYGFTRVVFARNVSTGRLEFEIYGTHEAAGQLRVKGVYSPRFGDLKVYVYGAKQIEAEASFDRPFHSLVSQAVLAFIRGAAER